MIRNRFNELQTFLESKFEVLNLRKEQSYFDLGDIKVTSGGRNESDKGYHFCNFSYNGVIYIERMAKDQVAFLAVLVQSWLDNHDSVLRQQYQLEPFTVDLIPLDVDNLVDVMLSVDFIDEVYLAPADEAGANAVEWCGKLWTSDEYVINIAESGTVEGAKI